MISIRRNHEVKIRLNDDEFEDLITKVTKSKLSREKYLRQCLKRSRIIEPPVIDYYKLINEFNAIGNNLNQIAKSLNATASCDEYKINETIIKFEEMIENLNERVRG